MTERETLRACSVCKVRKPPEDFYLSVPYECRECFIGRIRKKRALERLENERLVRAIFGPKERNDDRNP